MKLADYLAQPGNSATQLAKAMGVSPSTIYRAASGEIIPSMPTMMAIYAHTNGAVAPNDFGGIGQ